MSSAESTPGENAQAPIPPSSILKQRLLKACLLTLLRIVLGAIVGAIGLGIVGALITSANPISILFAGIFGAILGGVYGALFGTLHRSLVVFLGEAKDRMRRNVVIHLVCIGTVTALAGFFWFDQAKSLPSIDEVHSMVGKFWKPDVHFSVSPQFFETMLTALSPASRDWSPAKWSILGSLKIVLKDGAEITVDLYQTVQRIGAFSVHPGDRPRNSSYVSNYFRGGTDEAIKTAFLAAYENSKGK